MKSLHEYWLAPWDHEPKRQEARDSVLECARRCAAFAFTAHLKAPEHWAHSKTWRVSGRFMESIHNHPA